MGVKMKHVFFLVLIVLIESCGQKSANDLLLEQTPGEAYTIDYNKSYGLFLIKHDNNVDTISLFDNWYYALYRYRQQTKQFDLNKSYDDFLKSPLYCLPGSEAQYNLINVYPEEVFSSQSVPTFCDCIQENGVYNTTSVRCEEKFQIFRVGYNDSLQWYYNFYKDICNGEFKDTISFTAYKDTTLNRAKRAEIKAKRLRAIQDSLDNIGPKRRCSASVWIPPHQRSSSSRDYEQCRGYTSHSSGRCTLHR